MAEHQPQLERELTDESLRLERERSDDALAEMVSTIDETADAVINRARARADAVLAAARAKTDGQPRPHDAPSTDATLRQRAMEDATLKAERAVADETVREERVANASLLSLEREETDRDLSRERARSDAAVATRDEFLGLVSHDLRNMLGTVMGSAELIGRAVSEADHTAPILLNAQRIQRSGARMNRLIGDLVDVASIEAGMLAVSRELADPALVVAEAVESFQAQASARGVSLVTEVAPSMPHAWFDPARILQVLTNLLSNAVKFTTVGKVIVRVLRVGEELEFSVVDTGEGIAGDKLEMVFERFRQVAVNDRRGVGLGLYISKCIVQGHGGRIWVESKPGQGSMFSFCLPLGPPTSPSRSPPPPHAAAS